MEQLALIPSGVQLWARQVVAARSEDDPEEPGSNLVRGKIAFCSSLAVFVIEASSGAVCNILAGYEGLLTSMCWSLYDSNIIATASEDGSLVMWDLEEEKRLSVIRLRQAPTCLSWFPAKKESTDPRVHQQTIVAATSSGSIILWHAGRRCHSVLLRNDMPKGLDNKAMSSWKESNRATVIRCNVSATKSEVVCGFKDGRIVLVSVDENALANTEQSDKGKDTPSTHRVCNFYFEKTSKTKKGAKEVVKAAVVDLQWDPFSPDYLLAAYQDARTICLWDCSAEKPQVVQQFHVPSKIGGVLSLEWQVWAPGNFMSVSEKGSGTMQVWNVSQTEPIDTLQVSNGSSAAAFRAWGSLCVVALDNGAVMAYNARRKLRMSETKASHRETVFDIRFNPGNPNEMASCSFDGRVKVWDVQSLKCIRTLRHKNKPILYSLCWCPPLATGGKLLATSTYTGMINIWDAGSGNGKLLCSQKLHSHPVYRVDWNQNDPSLIASSSADRFVIVSQVDISTGSLKTLHKLSHPDRCFGCAWSCFHPGPGLAAGSPEVPLIAAGCQDGKVYVWNSRQAARQFVLKGHTRKVFHVAWNPINPRALASGSDDFKVMIWHLPLSDGLEKGPQTVAAEGRPWVKISAPKSVSPSMVLTGHTRNVRALLWSSEMEHILLSGSWDGTIKIWDTSKGYLLHTVVDHHADVYGLHSHPERPFCIVSSSRDTTIRFWQLFEPRAIEQASLELVTRFCLGNDSFGSIKSSGVVPATLQGKAGKRLVSELDMLQAQDPSQYKIWQTQMKALQLIATFFYGKKGLGELFKLTQVNSSKSKHKIDTSEACQATFECNRLVQAHIDTSVNASSVLRFRSTDASATAYVQALCKIGDFRVACEYLVQVGKWTQALALAPAVSMEYWRQLNEKFAQSVISSDPENAVQHFMAAGESHNAVDLYRNLQQYESALLLSQVELERVSSDGWSKQAVPQMAPPLSPCTILRRERLAEKEQAKHVVECTQQRDAIAKDRANFYLARGEPLLAACCMLGVGDASAAISMLLLAGEETLALLVGTIHKYRSQKPDDHLLKAVAAKCERVGAAGLALQILKRTRNASIETCLLTCRVNFSNQVRRELGLRQTDHYLRQSKEAQAKGQDVYKTLQLLCASHNAFAQTKAVQLGIEHTCKLLRSGETNFVSAKKALRIIQTVNVNSVLPPDREADKHMLLALSSFCGALQAVWNQYDQIVHPMLKNLAELMSKRPELDYPFTSTQVAYLHVNFLLKQAAREECAKKRKQVVEKAKEIGHSALEKTDDSSSIWQEDLKDILHGADQIQFCACSIKRRVGNVSASSRALPNGNTRHGKRSMFTNEFIKGECLHLQQGKALYLSMVEAVLWAKVNPFSPVNTGEKLFAGFCAHYIENKPTNLQANGQSGAPISNSTPSSSSSSSSSIHAAYINKLASREQNQETRCEDQNSINSKRYDHK